VKGKFQSPLIGVDLLSYCYQADWTQSFEFKGIREDERTTPLKETEESR